MMMNLRNRDINANKTRDTVFIALFAVLIAVCSWISIPTAIPFTMQTFGVFFALNFLGGKKGTLCVCIYLLLGLIGIPVYANGTAGAVGLWAAFCWCVFPFIIPDLAKLGLVLWLTKRLDKIVKTI